MEMENEVYSVIRIRARSFSRLAGELSRLRRKGELKFADYLLRNCALTVESLIDQPSTPVTSTLTWHSRTKFYLSAGGICTLVDVQMLMSYTSR